MASQGGESRLAQMQMRFQQKQRQEREQRKMEMTATKLPHQETLNNTITIPTGRLRTIKTTATGTSSSVTSTTKSTNSPVASLDSSIGAGKVRQMFNERRRGVGIDKSNPLKPINSLDATKGRTKSEETRKKVITSSDLIHQAIRNGGSDLNLNENTLYAYPSKNNNPITLDNETFPDDINGFGLTTVKMPTPLQAKSPDSNNNPSRGASIKLKPVITKKAPPRKSPITPTPKSMVVSKKSPTISNIKNKSTSMSSPTSAKAPATPPPPPRSTTPPPGTVECKICKRFFNSDRIEKHEVICEKTVTKKRKPFDATKHRVKGTDAEKYITKKKPSSSVKSTKAAPEPAAKKSNWRSKHEDFINAIRAAKQVQAHLAKGGKLSDLPPPPPSENPDYIQCPHCQRRFNEAAASRHIPKCANMLHNKPKPGAQPKRR